MLTPIIKISLCGIVLTAWSICYAVAQVSSGGISRKTLFQDTKPLEIILSVDIHKMMNDTSATSDYIPGIITEQNENGDDISYSVKVKPSGNMRLNPSVCEFPPLRINFKKSEVENTTFDKQDKIKLITHCREVEDFENHVMLEYLAYRSYNVLTEYSHLVRRVNITYNDLSGKYDRITRSGFFVESDEQMAERVGGVISEKKIWSSDSCRQDMVALVTLFEFMIGNTDWWINTRHNITLIELANGDLIPVGFDFDYAGLVDAPYAVPNKSLPITLVRQRFLKTDCVPLDFFEEAIKFCIMKKAEILSMTKEELPLEKRFEKSTENYLEDFFKIIENNKDFEKYLTSSCDYFSHPDKYLK